MNIDHTIDIACPPERVWELLSDAEQVKRWVPELVSDEPTEPGPLRVGTTTRMMIREGSKVTEYGSEVTALDVGRRLELRLTGGNLGAGPMTVSYRLEPREQGATLSYEARWRAHGLILRILEPVITLVSRRNARRNLATLRRLAEDGRAHTHLSDRE